MLIQLSREDGLVQLEEEDWQKLLKTAHLLVFIGAKSNHTPSPAF